MRWDKRRTDAWVLLTEALQVLRMNNKKKTKQNEKTLLFHRGRGKVAIFKYSRAVCS